MTGRLRVIACLGHLTGGFLLWSSCFVALYGVAETAAAKAAIEAVLSRTPFKMRGVWRVNVNSSPADCA